MKKFILLQCFFLLAIVRSVAQDISFNPPFFQQTVKGDMIVVGNSILNVGNYPANTPYTGSHGHNARIELNYIDIDGDGSTFNSSSANVVEPVSTCAKKVVKAYLYWAAAYTEERVNNQQNPSLEKAKFKNVKFKVGSGAYHNLTGTMIYDGGHQISSTWGGVHAQKAYVYRAEVTNLLSGIGGTYTVGNIQAPHGTENSGVGYAAGWTLVIVYEDLARESRNISLFNGFSVVGAGKSPNINISGFKTVPSGPVKAKIGFAALEGELGITGDQLWINGKKLTSVPARNGDNFFNSKVTNEGGENLNRTPASTNLLGFDIGIFNLPNHAKDILDNNATSAIIRPYSTGDAYYPFFFAFNVEVIAPHIVMEKRVYDVSNNDVTGATNIAFGSSLRYKIRFRNTGNDDAKNLVITEVLPSSLQNNVTGINVPPGVTASTYNPNTREIKFTVSNHLVKRGSAWQEISFEVRVANSCNDWRDPCANQIANSVSATYNGVENPTAKDFTAKSFPQAGSCDSGTEAPTLFTVATDFSKCAYKETVTLCQANTVLTAADGFDSYKWEKTEGGNQGQKGTGRTLTVSEAGTYKVTKTKAGCATMYEIYEVKPNPTEGDHPIYKMIENRQVNGELYTCPDTGQYYPQVYLCGANASVNLRVSISNAINFVWQKKGSCNAAEAARFKECPPSLEMYNCSWTDVYSDNGTTTNRSLSQEGDYRLVVTYSNGAGSCVVYYYFKITKNNLSPKAEVTDVVCTTKGRITIKDVPATGYQFALLQGTTTLTNYQNNPYFEINNQGTYRVLIKQTVTKTTTVPCVFEINDLFVKKREPKLKVTVTPMACANNKGSMRIELTDAPYTPYSIVIRNNNQTGGTVTKVTSSSLIELTNYFNDGRYHVSLENTYGCNVAQTVEIKKITELKATATVLSPIMCGKGIIRVTASGGTKGSTYQFTRDGATYHNNFTGDYYDFEVTSAGSYNFTVVDANGCLAQASATIQTLPAPTFTVTDALFDCGAKAKITFSEPQSTVTYTYEYSVDGTAFQSGREFVNLVPGKTYTPTLRYKYGSTASCTISSTRTMGTAIGGNLIASAGVEKLIGCGTGSNEDKALVRFSNVQGGVKPYEYNFGDGVWTTTHQRWLLPGTYNLSVRDNIGCTRTNLKVVVPKKITEPVFTPSITYDCLGNGIVTLGNNKSTYTYTYQIDGHPVSSNVFPNLTPGTHTITIKYADANPPSKNVLFLEDFGTGRNGGNEYINKAYYLELQDGSMPKNGYGTPWAGYNREGTGLADGEYVVSQALNPNNPAWWAPTDHSGLPQGRVFFVNIGNVLGHEGAILYQRPMKDIIANKEIKFSVALMNLLGFNDWRYPSGAPDLSIELYANQAAINNNTPLVSVHINPRIRGAKDRNNWTVFERPLNPGNNTELIAVIRSHSLETNGNDLAMDDIYLYQEPESCGFTHTLTVNIDNDKAFGIIPNTEKIIQPKCVGEKGQYQVTLKNAPSTYYVSKDGGAFVATMGNPFKWTNITVGNHTVKLRAEQNNVNCEVTRTFTIIDPPIITVSASNVLLGCNGTTSITATATGGTGTKQFSLRRGTTVLYGYQNTPVFTVSQTGTYTVYVRDANNCEKSTTVSVSNAPTLTLTATTNAANNNYCLQGSVKGKVEVEVRTSDNTSTAPYVFQHNGTTVATQNATTYIFDNLNVGVHTFTVTDKNGCKATYTAEIKKPLTIEGGTGAIVSKDISCNAAPANRGKIELKVKDGNPPYRYVVKKGGALVQSAQNVVGNTATYETAVAGAYTIEVTDSKGCIIIGTATLVAAVAPTVTVTTTAVGCYGTNNGTLSVTISGGKAPYKVFLDGVDKGSQLVFTNLAAKSYIVKVVDANNCDVTKNATIAQPTAPLKAFAAVSQLIGCGTGANADKAEVRITNVSGGTPAYQYKFSGNYSNHNAGWLPAGVHTVYVKDAKGCELGLTVTVTAKIPEPTGTTYTITGYDCNGNATIRFTGTPTTYDYTYEIGGKTATGTTATITGLAPGSYTVTIKYKDTNSPAASILIQDDFGIGEDTCSANVASAIQCGPNLPPTPGRYVIGSNSSFFVQSHLSNWSNANDHTNPTNNKSRMLMIDIGNVGNGDVLYHKTVNIDPNRKIKYKMFVMNLEKVGMSGALPDIKIRLVNPITNTQIGSEQDYGTIARSSNPNDWHEFSGELNPGNITQVRIEIRTKSWAGIGCDMAVDDIYVYQVPKSCEQEITKQVVVPSGKEFKASVVSQTNVTCKGLSTGKVTFNIENLHGGNYRVSVDGTTRPGVGYTTPTTASTFEVDGLNAGVHTITFSHNGNCLLTRTVTITEPDQLTLTATISEPAMCSNNNKARVTLTAGGGIPPYTYIYQDGGNTRTQTSNIFTGVAPGTPTFIVKDKNGCTTVLSGVFTVTAPNPVIFTTSVTTCYSNNSDGEIGVKINSGNGNYKVKLNNNAAISLAAGVTTHTFTGLTQGTYSLTVTDGYGCSTSTQVRIYPSLNSTVRVTHQSSCNTNAKIEVIASGGVGTSNIEYAYVLGSGLPNYHINDTSKVIPHFSEAVQTWTVYVRSAGCVKTHQVVIKKADNVAFTAATVTPTCQGSATGKIVLKNIQGDGNFTVRYGNGGTPVIATYAGIATNTYTIANVAAGVYSVTVTDKYGCNATQSVTLADMPALTATITLSATVGGCASTGSAATLTLTMGNDAWTAYRAGGNQIYYEFNNSNTWHLMPNNPHYILPLSGVTEPGKTIQVRFATRPSATAPNVCSTAAMAYVVPLPLGGVSVTTNLGQYVQNCTAAGNPLFTATVTVAPGKGQPPYQFNINGGTYVAANVNSVTHVFTGLVVGRTYTFGVKDANGCEAAYTGDIYASVSSPAISAMLEGNPACHGANGNATLKVRRSNAYNSGASTSINWAVYDKATNAVAVDPVTSTPISGTAAMPGIGAEVVLSTFTLSPNKTYYAIISEGTCQWGSRDLYIRELATLSATVSQTATITCDSDGVLEVQNPTGGGGTYQYTVTPVTAGVTFGAPIVTGSSRVQIVKDNITAPAMPKYPNGAYTFQVKLEMKDQYGCTADLGTYTFTVTPAPSIAKTTILGCTDGQYTLTVEPQAKTGAVGAVATGAELNGYEYSIDGGLDYQSSNVFANLVAGPYDVQIRDKSTGCIATKTVTIINALEADIALTTPLGCGGSAEITVKVDNGSGDYEYSYTSPGGAITGPTTIAQVGGQYKATFNPTVAGVYTVTVKDKNASGACGTYTKSITVRTAEKPEITTSVKSVTCAGGNDGVIYLTEVNAAAVGTFTYAVQGPSGAVPPTSIINREVRGLTAGVYTITITAANGCTNVHTATITAPLALTVSKTLIENHKQEFSCGSSGSVQQAQITVPNGAVQGGTQPYAIEYMYGTVTGIGNSFTIGNIAGGIVTITVTDAKGCSTQTSVVVKPFEAFDVDKIDFAVTTTGTCNASETITISATQSSGAPFTGQLLYYQGATAPTGALTPTTGGWQTSNSFTIAPNRTYTFWVANRATGCIASKLYISPDPNNFSIVNPQVKNVGCKGINDGAATFTLSNTVNGHTYNVTVSPSAGTITPASPFTATGTTATFNIAGLAPNTYTVTVKDNNTACEQVYSFKIEEPTAPVTASVTVRQATCASAPTYNSGEIAIENVTGGWGTYQYYIGQAAAGLEVWTNTSVRTGLTPGTYRVLVKDSGNCAVTLSNTVTIATPTIISGTLTVTNANCTNGTGAIGVRSVTGGEGTNYLYQLIKDGVAQGGAQTSTEFQNLSAGNYQVAISDSWGCTTTLTQSVTLYEPVEGVGVRFIKQVTCTPATGATISVTYAGGNSPSLRYTLKNIGTGVSTTSTTNGFTNVPAGNYEVSVYDAATGCPTQTHTFDVTAAATVSFTYTTTSVSCNGSSDGKLKITIPGSQTQTDYQINIVGSGGFTRSETVNTTPKDIEFIGMPAGTYTVTLTSARNCTATETIVIGAPATLIVSNTTTVTTHYKCDTNNNAQQAIISAVAQGGTQPYQYNYQVFDGTITTTSGWISSSVYSLTSAGSATQTVIVNVEDANGCRAVYTPMVVPPLQRISEIKATRISTLSCNQSETVNFTIVGGKNLGYRVEAMANGSVATPTPSTQTLTAGTNVATINFNAPGYYTIKVTDIDTGCYATVSYTVSEFRAMEVSAAQSKPVSCVGDSNGEITVTFSGYQGAIAYQAYTVSPTLAPVGTLQTQIGSPDAVRKAVISGLPKGSYVVRIEQTSTPNCTVTSTEVMISEPATALTATPTVTDRIKCGVGQTGAFKVEAAGGWSNYEYRLYHNGTAHPVYGTYTSTSLFEGLATGTYTVEVKDENGCATMVTQVMVAPDPIDATVTVTNVSCFSDRTGVISVQSITGGSGNYTYELKEKGGAIVRGAQTNTTFTGLDAREYVLIITDGWGCETQIEVEVTEPAELNIVASIASPLTCTSPATISLVATGGTGAYTYYQIKGGATTTVGSTVTVSAANVGDYEFYVKDANGCTSKVSNKITIAALEALALHVNTADAFVKCNGESSARITFSATGALGNYQYKLYKNLVAQPVSATQVNATDWEFSGLASGTYQVEVTSVDCVQTETVVIGESPAFVVRTATTDISCNTMRDGTISITVTGGAGDIQYAISPRLDRFVPQGYFTRLSRGEYVVRAQDKNGCFVDEIFKINEPDVLNAVIDKQTDEVCYGAGDGTVSITITGGTQSYSTSIDNGAWTVDKTLYTGLSVGTHTITVKDAHSCTTEVSVEIKEGVDLQATATVSYGCGNNTVVNTINATVNASYTGAVSYSLDGGAAQSSGRFTGVAPGAHTITFAHLNGCTTTLTVNVTAYNSLTVTTATKTDMSCYGVNDGTITFAVSGATNSYTYTITPEAGTFDGVSKYTGLSAGTYTVKVRSNGEINCELEHNFTIVEPDLLQANASTVSETCYGLGDGQLAFSIRGGRAPYSYTLKTASGTLAHSGTVTATGAVHTVTNVVGTYLLEYSDGQCSQSLQITVPSAPKLDIVDVKEQFNCSVVSTTYTTSYLRVEFSQADDKRTASNTLYSVDGGLQKTPFKRIEGKYGYTDIIPAGQYTLTVYYYSNVPGAPLCEQTWGSTVSLTRYRGLEIKDITDPRAINKIKVQAVGGNSSSYAYTFNGYQDGTNEYMLRTTDPTTRVVGKRIYKTVVVEVVDGNGCSSTLTIEKEYMKSVPPDFFTPNGDGQNDGWDPDRYRSYPNLTVDIYDRYGRYITSLRSGQTWDGRYKGKELPTGDYWYILKTHEDGEDDQEYMGHFNLYRAAD